MPIPIDDEPICDKRLWLKNQSDKLDFPYTGPEPEEHSPRNKEEELQGLSDVLFGVRPPRTEHEKVYLEYCGGVQPKHGERKWIRCRMCSTEFTSTGFPGQGGSRLYPTICNPCADRRDSRLVSKTTKRSTYSD